MNLSKLAVAAVSILLSTAATAKTYNVLWFDTTPEYGGQASDALRQEMSDYLNTYSAGLFNSTYINGDNGGAGGVLAAQLAANSYDVIVFDSTSQAAKFSQADLLAVRSFYQNDNRNLLFDGNLYVRSIAFNASSDFPGINSSTGGLTVNEVFSLASRGGGIFVGTDHNCCQTDANQIVSAILPGVGFFGDVSPSNDGVFTGTELLNVKAPVAPADLLAHYSSIPSQGIAPTGLYTDFLGNAVTLYSQLNIAGFVGGPRNSFISTSFLPGGGSVVITDPNAPPPLGGVPEPATWAMMILGFSLIGSAMRRAKKVSTRVSFA